LEKAAVDYQRDHRKRLREKFLDDQISESERIELLLCYAIPRVDVKPAAKELTAKFGGIHNIIAADATDLCKCRGVGRSAAVLIALIRSLMLEAYRGKMKDTPLFHNAQSLHNYCRLSIARSRVEQFHVLYLDANHRLIQDDVHTTGTTDHVAVYPREVLRQALDLNARNVVLLHNHPDGNRSFSSADIELTMKIKEKLAVDGIEVLDHLLVADGLLYSAKNLMLYK
jgi:DNA repair protein RadC